MIQKSLLTKQTISKKDVGYTEAQIFFLTERVSRLSQHLKLHNKDYSSQRGLRKLLGRRKGLLTYLARQDFTRYTTLISQLGIRGTKKTS